MKSAQSGLGAWLVQRASALYVLLFGVYLLVALQLSPRESYTEWQAWLTRPGMTAGVLGFFAALLLHMWVGLRDVLLDYARPARLRRGLLGLLAAGLAGMAAWVVWILLRAQG